MTREQQRLADYLEHIREAIERIDRYVEDVDEVAFLQNELVQDAVIRNLEIIGEASHNIEQHCPEFAAGHPELPLAFAYQMRMPCLMATSRWIWKSSGKPFAAICRDCTNKSRSLSQG